jgi:hypothetical protein
MFELLYTQEDSDVYDDFGNLLQYAYGTDLTVSRTEDKEGFAIHAIRHIALTEAETNLVCSKECLEPYRNEARRLFIPTPDFDLEHAVVLQSYPDLLRTYNQEFNPYFDLLTDLFLFRNRMTIGEEFISNSLLPCGFEFLSHIRDNNSNYCLENKEIDNIKVNTAFHYLLRIGEMEPYTNKFYSILLSMPSIIPLLPLILTEAKKEKAKSKRVSSYLEQLKSRINSGYKNQFIVNQDDEKFIKNNLLKRDSLFRDAVNSQTRRIINILS